MSEHLLMIIVGIGLAATCGFRVFVPPLVLALAAHTGHITLPESMEWMASTPAIALFATAAVLEIGSYYIPWLDNLLDTIATPAAAIGGILLSAGMMGDVSPILKWSVGIIAGGGLATTVQLSTVALRGLSTGTTGGAGNPVVSTGEVAAASTFSLLMIIVPLVGIVLLVTFIIWGLFKLIGVFRGGPPTQGHPQVSTGTDAPPPG